LGFILVTPFWHQAISQITELGRFIFNILLAILAWGLIQEGLKLRKSNLLLVWYIIITLQIISRVLEYNTEVLFPGFSIWYLRLFSHYGRTLV
jgi:Predicted membrane protein